MQIKIVIIVKFTCLINVLCLDIIEVSCGYHIWIETIDMLFCLQFECRWCPCSFNAILLNCYFNIFSCQAVPFFLGAIAVEYILCFLTNVPRTRLNDAFSSIAAGIFSQLSK